jgi:hypothetical protein
MGNTENYHRAAGKPSRTILAIIVLAMVLPLDSVFAATKSTREDPLTAAGSRLLAQYADSLTAQRAQITKAIPLVDEQKKSAFLSARAAAKVAAKEANAKQKALDEDKALKGLLNQRKGWVSKASKAVTAAEEKVKQATTESGIKAAQEELAKAQADALLGASELKKTQDAVDKAKPDELKVTQAYQAAQAALAQAQANEMLAAKVLLTEVEPFLASEQRDTLLVKCAVLAEATPQGLAEFAQQGKQQEDLVDKLLADDALMKQMLEAGGARGGKYGQAMNIYTDIQKASPQAREGILQRLALGTSLEHAVPVGQRNAVAKTDGPTTVDPVQRYLHYEKAYLNGELDPAFKNMTAWECRMIVNSDAPDDVLAWGRQMLRNYRPDQILTSDYGWRYSVAVRTDVPYRHSQDYKDTDALDFFQNIIKNGGICGRRAFFGRYIVQSFGLPAWGVTQHAHAAVGRWTPTGWVVNLGANWQWSWFEGRTGLDFLLETQARKYPKDYLKVLRAQWVGDALGEPKVDSMKDGSGGFWNVLALFQKKVIVAEAKPVELPALGQELAEANESPLTNALGNVKATVTEADEKIVIAPNGVITIPAAACSHPPKGTGGILFMKSFLGGLQMHCRGGNFSYDVAVPSAGKYALTASVVTVHDEVHLQLTPNNTSGSIDMVIPYTCGRWQQSAPVEVTLVQGKNVLSFSKPTNSFTIKEFSLTPVR